MQDLTSVDVLCLLEADETAWKRACQWLEEKKERKVISVDSRISEIAHPQVQWEALDSPLQIEPLAKKIAWESVFLKMEIVGGQGTLCQLFRKELETACLAARLLLSDAADWGGFVAKHSYLRKDRPVREGMKLEGAFSNIPALIVGAGPSLARNGDRIEDFQDRALIFAGGSALSVWGGEPHFAAAIDKEAPYREFKRQAFWETPFCFQSRMNPENFSLVHGEAILFPDSHFQFLNEGPRFDAGWTVGTFLVALATLMGCNPIVFVGMDYCYEAGRKYAEREAASVSNLIETTAKDGSKVWTQPDWLMAKTWLEEWAKKHPKTQFINATEGGIGFSSPIGSMNLSDLSFEKKDDLKKKVHQAVSELPFAKPIDWEAWKESLERCGKIADAALFGGEEGFEGERAYETLLLPLWGIWSHVFTRALAQDPHPEKLKINRLLFFQQVIQEHLRAIESALLS